MKLPDFFKFDPFTEVKRQMGIPADVFGSLRAETVAPNRMTAAELERLTSGEGIDVAFADLTILSDGTLAYKDSRVLLYIRDVYVYGDEEKEPRYHLSNCRTLQNMNAHGKFERYVIAAEVTGTFKINLIANNRHRTENRKLFVCQNCLSALSFDGFNQQMSKESKQTYLKQFTPARFFERFPRSLHVNVPTWDSEGAPINDYTSDFSELSRAAKEQAGWICEKCSRLFAEPHLQKFLHSHHIGGNRQDNRRANLKILCVECHSEEFNHAHVGRNPQHAEYLRIKHTLKFARG